MKNITSIIFDLGGVILNINYKNTIESFEALGIKDAQNLYSKNSQTDIFNKIEIGEIDAEEFLSTLQKKTTNSNIQEIKKAWNAMIIDLPEKRIKFLKKLRLKYSIFLLSNTNTIHINKFQRIIGSRKYNEFYKLFHKIYYSHEIGLRKPNTEAFEMILRENHLSAKNVLFIDDSIQHIKSARKLGINVIHLSNHQDITTLFPDITL